MATNQHIEKTPAFQRAGVYVILDAQEGKINTMSGKLLVAYPKDGAGILRASLWDFTPINGRDVQNGRATGYGYDKLSAAIDGMKFGSPSEGREFTLDCDGTGFESAAAQFAAHGYILQWVV